MKKIISFILLLAWMIIIFIFSSQSGDGSTTSSNFIVDFIYNIISIDKNILIIIVRKLAHMFEYFILYILAYNFLKQFNSIKYSICYGVLYAIFDEFHQLFVPGRSGSVIDVFVDTIGIIIGFLLIEVLYGKKENKKIDSSKI